VGTNLISPHSNEIEKSPAITEKLKNQGRHND
jgi:hypothetical protein